MNIGLEESSVHESTGVVTLRRSEKKFESCVLEIDASHVCIPHLSTWDISRESCEWFLLVSFFSSSSRTNNERKVLGKKKQQL